MFVKRNASPSESLKIRGARRGNFIVAALLILTGLFAAFGGIYTLLKNQIDASLALKNVALANTQSTYLAEMGINAFMYQANQTALVPVGNFMDLTQFVKMTRTGGLSGTPPVNVFSTPPASFPDHYAYCWILTIVAGTSYQSHAQLKIVADTHVYEKTLNFTLKSVNGQFALASYAVE